MATNEGASASLGPRYAPDDPSLPQPWKGLIDGSNGVLYYWNPETNVTQYERPSSLPPSMPNQPPPTTPNLAPVIAQNTAQPDSAIAQQGQQQGMAQQISQPGMAQQQGIQFTQQGHHYSQLSQQHGPVMAQQQSPGVQSFDQGSQMGQPGQFASQPLRPQTGQHPGQHILSYAGQQIPQRTGLQMPQGPQQLGQTMQQHPAAQQMPQQLGNQMMQGSQTIQPQGHQYNPQQSMGYQQSVLPQSQQNSQHQSQYSGHVQQIPHQQEYKGASAFPKSDAVDYHQGNQKGFPHFQQTSPSQNPPIGSTSIQMPTRGGHLVQNQHVSGSMVKMQQNASPMQQSGPDNMIHMQHGARFQNQMPPGAMPDHQLNGPSIGLSMGNEELRGRTGNDYYVNHNKDGPAHQPKLAALPMSRNQQERRIEGAPFPHMAAGHAGGLGVLAVPGMAGMNGPVAGGPPAFPNNAIVRPSFVGSPDISGLSPAEMYRQQHEITAMGDNIPAPFITFESTGFPPEILREVTSVLTNYVLCDICSGGGAYVVRCPPIGIFIHATSVPIFEDCKMYKSEASLASSRRIRSAGFASPTPIQAQTWPISLQGRDVVATAKTGSGKTLGYLIPAFILMRQRHNNPQNGPTVLVLAPTRELATQIQDEVIKFGRSSRVSCTCLYGGAQKGPQLKELDRGVDIVVATPGRLNDILEMKKINFVQISLLVLDEADRMLDMGFEPQIRKIVNEIPPRRQTLMFTATWPKEVRKIAGDLLVNPVQVNIGNVDELAANKAITQYIEVVPQMEKERRLEQIIRGQERGSKIIIFCSTKRLCDQLARNIGRTFGAAAIHGDKSQGERDWVLNQFRSGKSPILVATDVAARGLDIKDIRVVINFDFPNGMEDYVHRIGRTGRAGASGVSYTFLSEQDWKHAIELVKFLEAASQHVPPEVRDMALRGGPGFSKDRGSSRFDSGNMNNSGGGRWDSGGRGGGFGARGGFGGRGGFGDAGRGGMRDGGGRGGEMRDGGFSGRGGGFGGRGGDMRDGGFGGRGGDMRDGGFGGRGGNRGRGFGGPSGGNIGWGRNERGTQDRFNMDSRGGGRGRGRFDSRRDVGDRSRGRSYSRSPERVRTWGYSSSRSRSRSRSRSYSRSRSRGRSYSRSPSRSRSHGRKRSRSRSRSRSHGGRSYDKRKRSHEKDENEKDATIQNPEMSPKDKALPASESVGQCAEAETNVS